MVAPNGARPKKKDHSEVPVTISEIVSTAKTCFDAGAGAIHFHIRDREEKHVLDPVLWFGSPTMRREGALRYIFPVFGPVAVKAELRSIV